MTSTRGRTAIRVVAASIAAALGLTASAAPQTTALCDGLAAKVRASKDVVAGATDIFSLATKGPSPYFELAAPDPKGLSLDRDPAPPDRIMFEKRIRTRFGNAEALIKELRNWDFLDIMTLPASDVHMVVTTGGTAACEARIFFRTTVNREVELLPQPPAKSDHDATNAICENVGGRGYLARVNSFAPQNGVEAFLEYHAVDGHESFRIVPLSTAGWQTPCTMSAEFKTKHRVTQVYVPQNPPISDGVFRNMVAQLLDHKDEVPNPKLLTFGPALTESHAPLVKSMLTLAAGIEQPRIPGFGKDNELEYTTLDNAESYPIVIGDKSFLMRIGVGRSGCCVLSDPILVFYRLQDGKLEPIASVFTTSDRGAMVRLDSATSK